MIEEKKSKWQGRQISYIFDAQHLNLLSKMNFMIGHQSQDAFGTFLENQAIFGSFQALQHWQQPAAAKKLSLVDSDVDSQLLEYQYLSKIA